MGKLWCSCGMGDWLSYANHDTRHLSRLESLACHTPFASLKSRHPIVSTPWRASEVFLHHDSFRSSSPPSIGSVVFCVRSRMLGEARASYGPLNADSATGPVTASVVGRLLAAGYNTNSSQSICLTLLVFNYSHAIFDASALQLHPFQ